MRYAWGQAVDDFEDCVTPDPNPNNKLLADGVEILHVDFADTETLEYRTIAMDHNGPMLNSNGTAVIRTMHRATKSLEVILAESA